MYVQKFLNHLPDFIKNTESYYLVIADLNGHYAYVNEVFKRNFSFLNMDFIGKSLSVAIHPDDLPKCNEIVLKCLENPNKSFPIDIRKPNNDGVNYAWSAWDFSLLKDENNKPAGILCFGHDISDLEKANRKQEELNQKLETIIEEITEGFFIINHSLEFSKTNKAAEEILGIERDKLIGKPFFDLFPKKSEFNYLATFEKVLAENVTASFEDYVVDLNRWFRFVCYPSKEGIKLFFRDISEEYHTKKELEKSEQKLRAILDSTTDSNILISPDYKILSFNKQATIGSKQLFGKPLVEMADMWEYVIPTDKADFLSDSQKALNGEYLHFEREVFFEHGSMWFEISYFPVVDENENCLGFTFNTTNIDVRKKAEIKLKQSETMLKALYDSTSQASTFITKDFKIIFSNRLALDICKSTFGKEPQLGDHFFEYIVPEFKEEMAQFLDKVLLGEKINFEKKFNDVWWRFSFFPVYTTENELVGISYNLEDITEKKNSELKIVAQNELLRQIAWTQSHEVRRPLANIMGITHLLTEGTFIEASEHEQFLNLLLQSTDELDQIVHEIVDKSKKIEHLVRD